MFQRFFFGFVFFSAKCLKFFGLCLYICIWISWAEDVIKMVKLKRNKQTADRQTDRQMDGQTDERTDGYRNRLTNRTPARRLQTHAVCSFHLVYNLCFV